MKNLSKVPSGPTPPVLVKGQVWQIESRFVKIGHVGRLLVNHRTMASAVQESRFQETLSGIRDLQAFLKKNNAVLLKDD